MILVYLMSDVSPLQVKTPTSIQVKTKSCSLFGLYFTSFGGSRRSKQSSTMYAARRSWRELERRENHAILLLLP